MIVDLTEDDNNESHRDRSLTVPVLPEMSSLAIPPLVVPPPVVPPQNTARTSGFQAPFLAPSISLSQIYRDGNGGQRVNLGEMARMIQNQGQRALSASMASHQRQIPFQTHYLPCPFPPSMPSQQLPSLSASTRVLPSSVTTGHAPQSAYAANMAMRQIALPPPKVIVAVEPLSVRFSIIDSFNFTARAETGKVTDNIINCLKRTPGAKFDRRNSRWLFPISSHQILRSALSHQRCHVEPVPQHVLVATQLKMSALESSSSSSAASSSSTLDLLSQHLPQKVLDNLASFQQEAVKFIFDKGGRALIADEMGLGKTRTAIAGATLYQDNWPVLVVCPSSARFHWQAELLTMLSPELIAPREITVVESAQHSIVSGSKNFSYKFIIISYALVPRLIQLLEKVNFGIVIADESHYLKTRKAQRTKTLVPLIQKAKRAMLLSGTPALSRPVELFCQLNALNPEAWPDFKAFGKRYCVDPRPTKEKSLYNSHNRFNYGENAFKGANNTQELHVILTSTVMIRRLKDDILKQLPPKKRYLVKVTIEDETVRLNFRKSLRQLSQYEELLSKAKARRNAHKKQNKVQQRTLISASGSLGSNNNGLTAPIVLDASSDDENVQKTDHNGDEDSDEDVTDPNDPMASEEDVKTRRKSLLMDLFRGTGTAKLPAILKQLQKFLDDNVAAGSKVLVFAHHRSVLDALTSFLREQAVSFIRIDGMTKSSDRHQRTQNFQTDPTIRVAVLGITAAGIALTLTAANVVFFAEMFWTPGSLIQAEDRAHRIGQLRSIKVFYFFAQDSVDELLWPLVRKKLQLLGEIVEGKHDLDLSAHAKDHVHSSSSGSSSNAQSKSKGSISAKPNNSSSSSSTSKTDGQVTSDGDGEAADRASADEGIIDGVRDVSASKTDLKAGSDTDGRLVFDLIEDEDAMADLVNEMARDCSEDIMDGEGVGGPQSHQTSSGNHSDDSDNENGVVQADDYEEYLKRPNIPDRLAQYYIRQTEIRERANLAQLQLKYQQQEQAIAANPHLSSFLQASQMMEWQHLDSSEDINGSSAHNSEQFGEASLSQSPALPPSAVSVTQQQSAERAAMPSDVQHIGGSYLELDKEPDLVPEQPLQERQVMIQQQEQIYQQASSQPPVHGQPVAVAKAKSETIVIDLLDSDTDDETDSGTKYDGQANKYETFVEQSVAQPLPTPTEPPPGPPISASDTRFATQLLRLREMQAQRLLDSNASVYTNAAAKSSRKTQPLYGSSLPPVSSSSYPQGDSGGGFKRLREAALRAKMSLPPSTAESGKVADKEVDYVEEAGAVPSTSIVPDAMMSLEEEEDEGSNSKRRRVEIEDTDAERDVSANVTQGAANDLTSTPSIELPLQYNNFTFNPFL